MEVEPPTRAEVGPPAHEMRDGHRVFGWAEFQEVPIGLLILLSQVREGANPVLDSLQESIDRVGMLNQPDVAKLRKDELQAYIEANNAVWKARHKVEDYDCDADGWYYLVMAGHSRSFSAMRISGDNSDNTVYSRIEMSPTPERILAVQLAENHHERPSQERRAMAIVEMYKYGLDIGTWKNKKEFLEYNGKITRYELNEALHFIDLPPDLQGFVFNGSLAYRIGSELGKSVSVVRSYLRFRQFNNQPESKLSASELEELNDLERTWLQVRVAHIQNSHMNGPAAVKHIKALVSQFSDEIAASEYAQELPFEMMSPEKQRRDYLHVMQLELDRLIRSMADKSITANARALSLHTRLHPKGETLRTEIESKLKRTLSAFGDEAMQASKIAAIKA